MRLYVVVYVAGQIIGVSGPYPWCPKAPSHLPSRYEVRCEEHAKRPEIGLRLVEASITQTVR